MPESTEMFRCAGSFLRTEGFFNEVLLNSQRKSEIESLKHEEIMMLIPALLCSVAPAVNCFFFTFWVDFESWSARNIFEHFLQSRRWPPGKVFDS